MNNNIDDTNPFQFKIPTNVNPIEQLDEQSCPPSTRVILTSSNPIVQDDPPSNSSLSLTSLIPRSRITPPHEITIDRI